MRVPMSHDPPSEDVEVPRDGDLEDVVAVPLDDPEAGPAVPSAGLLAAASRIRIVRRARRGLSGVEEILQLSWPVMLSQVLATSVGLVDIAMVGRVGPDAVAAAGYAGQLYFMAQSALFAVGFACVALMAQSIGAGKAEAARQALASSLLVAVATAILLGSLVLAAPGRLLVLLNAEPAVIAQAVPYLRLIFAASLLLAVSLTLENALRANRDTVTPMRIALAVTVVKFLLNILLIFGVAGFPRLGLLGAGWATLLSQCVAVALFAMVARRAPVGSVMALRAADLRSAWNRVGDVVRIALPGIAERVILNMALLVYFALLGSYGTGAVAAYTVGVRLLAFSWIPGTGYGAAAATLVGQALGAGDEHRAERIGWQAAGIAVATAVALSVVGVAVHGPLARSFSGDADTVQALTSFMFVLALAQPLLQLHFALAGAHRGAGDTWTPLVAATVGNWLLRVPLAVLFAWWLHWDLMWVWSALVFDHLARSIWLANSFRRGGWRKASTA